MNTEFVEAMLKVIDEHKESIGEKFKMLYVLRLHSMLLGFSVTEIVESGDEKSVYTGITGKIFVKIDEIINKSVDSGVPVDFILANMVFFEHVVYDSVIDDATSIMKRTSEEVH